MRAGVAAILFHRKFNLDPDAQSFIDAAGINNATQIKAINKLVLNLKGIGPNNTSYNHWADCTMIKPRVGGNATAHSYNLLNPATFQSIFFGGVTHTANGVVFNGVNGYEDHNINSSNLNTADVSFEIYVRTGNLPNNSGLFSQESTNKMIGLTITDPNYRFKIADTGVLDIAIVDNPTLGYIQLTKAGLTTRRLDRNGTNISSVTVTNDPFTSATTWEGRASTNFGGFNSAFSVYRKWSNAANNTAFYNLVQIFQTDLGRAV